MKSKRLKILIFAVIVLIIFIILGLLLINRRTQLKTIHSKSQLNRFYAKTNFDVPETLVALPTLPWSFWNRSYSRYTTNTGVYYDTALKSSSTPVKQSITSATDYSIGDTGSSSSELSSFLKSGKGSTSKDYSTTNIQVENVDEADITKTDGDYIYSLSDTHVIITDVKDPKNSKIASEISPSDGNPVDLILYNEKLVVISEKGSNRYSSDTVVDIYDVSNHENPNKVKSYQLLEPYYTSRCINNKLYVFASGTLRKEDKEIVTSYVEDNTQKEIDLNHIHYLSTMKSNTQTLISMADLDNPSTNIQLSSYLLDISNAYVSEHNIYLADYSYQDNWKEDFPPILSLFGWKGIYGITDAIDYDYCYDSNYETTIYKFHIEEDGSISYKAKAEVEGKTINQFSFDEYNDNFRIAVSNSNGSKIIVFNNSLKKIGETSYLAKGEQMYSSRFIGDKAYLVTYQTIDPLFVIDLSNPTNPTVLGELKIPGYSTYLHPYDENHLIGIGMETKEIINRDNSGRIRSTTAKIVGMKMALFDVSNVNNPIQISQTVIGDSATTSAILTNHKALLFSKEKELLAIPVNHYADDFEITTSSDSYETMINEYTNYSSNYISEGYLVYNINLKDGFKLKGKITHEKASEKNTDIYSSRESTRLLRGLYIDNNLFTISEDQIKVNDLENLKLVTQLNLRSNKNTITTNTTKPSDTSLNQLMNQSQNFIKKGEK